MKMVNITYGKQIVLASNSNSFFDSNLEAKGCKPILKEKSVVIMVKLKEEYDLIYVISGELEPTWEIIYLPSKSILRYFKSLTRLYFYLKQAS